MSVPQAVGHPRSAKPVVSVIIPTRNRADHLRRALGSVLQQAGLGTQFDMDVIVVDDASSDSTPAVVRQYPSVRYVRLERQQGASAARNVGIRESDGQYVAFQDDDDLWLPHKLSTQVSAFVQRADVGLVYSQSVIKFERQEFLWPEQAAAPSGHVFRALLKDCFCGHPPCLLVRREAIQKAGGFDQSLGAYEDYDLWLRIAFHYPFLFVPGPVAVYHLRDGGQWLTSLCHGSGADDLRRITDKALRMLPQTRPYARVRQEVRFRTEWRVVEDLGWASDSHETWKRVLAFVQAYPEALRYRWVRGSIAMKAHNVAVTADSPIAAVRRLCLQLKDATANGGVRQRVRARLLLAAVWAVMAEAMSWCPKARARAAACAILQDPSKLRKLALVRTLLRPLTRRPLERVRASPAQRRSKE